VTNATLPSSSLSMFLDGIIDYAGLYPPASLNMQDMVSAWVDGLSSEQDWMLGRVIVPVDRLDEFEQVSKSLIPSGDDEEPWVISALLSPSPESSMEMQVERIKLFNECHANEGRGGAVIDVVEVPGTDAVAIDAMLDQLPEEVFPFFELPADGDIRGMLAVLVGSDAGAKIRTGGMKPESYPTTEQLSNFILQCSLADVPFKATAGLHHPLMNHNGDIGIMQFGFLNVFLASLLASAGEESIEVIESVLTRSDLAGIEFGDEGVEVDGSVLGLDVIEDARIAFSLSFGSCSIDEPVADLVGLGLLPATKGG
jgi:hypothetical protein